MAKPIVGDQKRLPIAVELTSTIATLSTNPFVSESDQQDLIDRLDQAVFADAAKSGRGGSRGFFGNLNRQTAEALQAAAQALLDVNDFQQELVERLESVVILCGDTVRIRLLQSPVWRAEQGIPNKVRKAKPEVDADEGPPAADVDDPADVADEEDELRGVCPF